MQAEILDKLLQHQNLAFVVADARQADLPIVFASEGFYRLTGYPAEEILGHNCRFLQGKETEHSKIMEIRTALREERSTSVVITNYRKDGTPFRNFFHMAPVKDQASGLVTQYVGVQSEVPMEFDEDLSEDSLAEPLRASVSADLDSVASALSEGQHIISSGTSSLKSSLVRVVNKIQQSFVMSDPSLADTPIVYASQGFLDLTGYRAEEVLGRNCRFLQGADTDPAAVASLRSAVEESRPATVRILNYRKDNTPFWNCIHICPIRNAEGKVAYFVGVQLDMSAPSEDKTTPMSGVTHSAESGRVREDDVRNGEFAMPESNPLKEKMVHMGVVGQVRVAVRGIGSDGLCKQSCPAGQ